MSSFAVESGADVENEPFLAFIPSTILGDCVGEKGNVRRDAAGVAAGDILEWLGVTGCDEGEGTDLPGGAGSGLLEAIDSTV